jgi:hypothetical protein
MDVLLSGLDASMLYWMFRGLSSILSVSSEAAVIRS